MSAFVAIEDLGKTYPGKDAPAVIVRNFNLEIAPDEFVCLIGHSGCGKTTVLMIVAGLTPQTTGRVRLDGRQTTGPGPDRAMVFQSPSLLAHLTAYGNVRLGVDQVFPHLSRAERDGITRHYLALVGLADDAGKRPGELSAGMRQRVGVARAVAVSPKLLLLDEPFGSLDSLTRFELQRVLLEVRAETRTAALMVTHDIDEALFLADRIVMMTDGPAAEVGDIMTVPFPRPRDRHALLADAGYYRCRERLIEFLETRARRH